MRHIVHAQSGREQEHINACVGDRDSNRKLTSMNDRKYGNSLDIEGILNVLRFNLSKTEPQMYCKVSKRTECMALSLHLASYVTTYVLGT